jgi:CPA2 family monovalent cation:H+ antiporter-2
MKGQPELLIEVGALLVVLGLLARVARRFGFSPVPLYLLAGLPVGAQLASEASLDFISVAAELGAILLLFALGLEFSADELRSSLRRHRRSGVVDLALNATPGAIAGWLLGLDAIGVLALAGITWTSSSGIVARLTEELGRLGNRETPAVLSVLVIEDIAMAAYLPLVAVLLAGGDVVDAAIAVSVAVGFVLLTLFLAPRVGGPLGRFVGSDDREQILLSVLGLTLVVAGFTGLLDASAAVGAFIVGLAIPPDVAERARTVILPLRDLFAAVFFFSFGFLIDAAQLPGALPEAAVLVVAGLLTKILTGWYAGGVDGIGSRGRWRAGTVLGPRGEFSVVIAGLAVAAGYTELGPLTAGYVLLAALVAPLLTRVRWPILRRSSLGRAAGP